MNAKGCHGVLFELNEVKITQSRFFFNKCNFMRNYLTIKFMKTVYK